MKLPSPTLVSRGLLAFTFIGAWFVPTILLHAPYPRFSFWFVGLYWTSLCFTAYALILPWYEELYNYR